MFKLTTGIFCFVLLCNATSLFAGKTPLSGYSSQWDYDYFNRANTTQSSNYLSQNEKEFIYILNLARISPSLFQETVLRPYFNRHGYSGLAYETLNRLKAMGNLPMLKGQIELKNQVKNCLGNIKTTDSLQTSETAYLLTEKQNKDSGAFIFSKSDKAIDIILQLLTNPSKNGVVFRDYFSGNYSDAGIFIKQHTYQGFVAAILLKKTNISTLLNNKSVNTFKQPKMVLLNEHPNDSILNYFSGIKKIINSSDNFYIKNITQNSVFKSKEDIEKMSDSLLKKNISYREQSFSHDVELPQIHAVKNNPKNKYIYTSSSFSAIINSMEADTALDFYYIGRTDDSLSLNTLVKVIHLTTDAPIPPFPADSIGIFDQSTSLAHVDQYVNSLGKVDDTKLAILLTKPWKKELEKVRAIFIWMVKNINYDYVGLNNGRMTCNAKDVLAKRVGVCAGYSDLFEYLCTQANIKTNYIVGNAPGGSHAWNTVRIDNKWYVVDVTWGSNYFLITPEVFIKDHYANTRKWSLLTNPMTYQEWKDKYNNQKK